MSAKSFQTCGFLDYSEQNLTRCLFSEGRRDCCFGFLSEQKDKTRELKEGTLVW